MEKNSPWEANSHSANQEIPRLLWHSKVYYRVHRGPPTVPILSHRQSNNSYPISLRSILILSSCLRIGLPSALPFRFSDPNCVCISHLSHVCYMTRPSHLPSLYHLIIFGEVYKLWSCSFCSLLQPPSISSLLSKKYFPQQTLLKNLSLCCSLSVKDQLSQQIKL
jgi:hypothetical protein